LNVLGFGLIEERVVKRMRDKLIRVSIVGVTIVAWLSISNHCAVGALVTAKTQSPMAQMHCHGDQPSPAKKDGGKEMPCCKVLRATIAKDRSMVQDPVMSAQPIQYPAIVEILLFSSLQPSGISNEFDTGPPFVSSFAELILQRSLFSHAPPFLS
jgi:hypothetical protein